MEYFGVFFSTTVCVEVFTGIIGHIFSMGVGSIHQHLFYTISICHHFFLFSHYPMTLGVLISTCYFARDIKLYKYYTFHLHIEMKMQQNEWKQQFHEFDWHHIWPIFIYDPLQGACHNFAIWLQILLGKCLKKNYQKIDVGKLIYSHSGRTVRRHRPTGQFLRDGLVTTTKSNQK